MLFSYFLESASLPVMPMTAMCTHQANPYKTDFFISSNWFYKNLICVSSDKCSFMQHDIKDGIQTYLTAYEKYQKERSTRNYY